MNPTTETIAWILLAIGFLSAALIIVLGIHSFLKANSTIIEQDDERMQ